MSAYTPTYTSKHGDTFASIPLTSEMPLSEDTYLYEKPQSSGSNMDTPTKQRQSLVNMGSLFWFLRFVIILVVIGVPLSVPIIVFRNDQDLEDEESIENRQYRQLVFYLFAWLLTSWLGGCVSYLLATGLPYLFRFGWRYGAWIFLDTTDGETDFSAGMLTRPKPSIGGYSGL